MQKELERLGRMCAAHSLSMLLVKFQDGMFGGDNIPQTGENTRTAKT